MRFRYSRAWSMAFLAMSDIRPVAFANSTSSNSSQRSRGRRAKSIDLPRRAAAATIVDSAILFCNIYNNIASKTEPASTVVDLYWPFMNDCVISPVSLCNSFLVSISNKNRIGTAGCRHTIRTGFEGGVQYFVNTESASRLMIAKHPTGYFL